MAILFHDRRDGSINEVSDKTLIRHFNSHLQTFSNLTGERENLADPNQAVSPSLRTTMRALVTPPEQHDGYMTFR